MVGYDPVGGAGGGGGGWGGGMIVIEVEGEITMGVKKTPLLEFTERVWAEEDTTDGGL